MTLIRSFKELPSYIGSNGRTEKEIADAEHALGITFAKDYREYLGNIGLASFDGHELTGLTKSSRLDVVSVTKEQRAQIGEASLRWYVIEEAGMDDIVIWQSSDGVIYFTAPNTKSKQIAGSLLEYIQG